jgi:DNA polymerase-3 subunit epsilon
MTREIALDTETTGLDPEQGHRVVEIGCVELVNHVPTGRTFHVYLNPERPVDPGAVAVHGLTDAFLADKPRFAEVAAAFESFVAEAALVIHNAPFDMGFLNAERRRLGFDSWPAARAIDTLALFKGRFPGAPASLDALCRRFGVDNSAREKHGALLDAELLAEVYLQLRGGRQPDFGLAPTRRRSRAGSEPAAGAYRPPPRPRPLIRAADPAEAAAHAAFVETLGPDSLWKRFGD